MSAGLIMANKIFVLIIVGLILIAFYLISPYRYKAILNKQIETTETYLFHTMILDTWTGETWLCETESMGKGAGVYCSPKIRDGELMFTDSGVIKVFKTPMIEGRKK